MADITAEIPTVEEVIANATRMSDVSTIVSEALERRSSNSSAAAFSPFIVADVKEVNDIPEVTMTQSVYTSMHAADIPAPPVTPLPSEDVPVLNTDVPLPESTESSIDHHPPEIDTEPLRDNKTDVAESEEDDVNSEDSDADADADAEESDADADADAEESDDDNSVHSQEDDHMPKAHQTVESQIPAEIMFLLFVVLILNSFNFLLSLTGARQCIRPS